MKPARFARRHSDRGSPSHKSLRHSALSIAVRSALCGGVALPAVVSAAPPAFGTPAWLAQRNGAVSAVAPIAGGSTAAPSAGVPGAVTTPQQALVQARRSMDDLTRAAAAIVQAQAAQSAARQLVLKQPNPAGVTEGLSPHGLEVASGVPRDVAKPAAGEDPSLWQNAALPTQAVKDGRTTVTVKQRDAKAILTWNRFDVGRNTTLQFDQRPGRQSDGSNEWVVLNRVVDPSARPSRILGEIRAEGSVYVINRNGIVFGGTSQVNTHSLIASSLAFLGDDRDLATSNRRFLGEGLLDPQGAAPSLVLGIGSDGSGAISVDAGSFKSPGGVVVEAGARLKTGETGFSLLAAPQLRNAGTIDAAGGQAILAAGQGVELAGSTLVSTSTPSANRTGILTVRLRGEVFGAGGVDATPVSVLTQTGLIASARGNVTLAGSRVDQLGVVTASTSLTRPGSIVIRAVDAEDQRAGLVRFGTGSTTSVLPLDNGSTTTSAASATAAFKVSSVDVEGGAVLLGRGALVEVPGGNVALGAHLRTLGALDGIVAGRVYVDHNAAIDVAGLADVQQSVSSSRVTVPRIGQNELANAPLQRQGPLFGLRDVVVDASLSGTRQDGLTWVGSPLLNVQGYVDLVPRKIGQLLLAGGKLGVDADEAVITRRGSRLHLDGGYVDYLPGRVQATTRLLGADGKTYDIGAARADIAYLGLAGSYVVGHPRWNQSDSYVDPLSSGKGTTTFDPGYIAGARAGTLTLASRGPALIEGDVSARALAGRNQVEAAALPSGGTLSLLSGGSGKGVVFQTGLPDLTRIGGNSFAAGSSLETEAQLAKRDTDLSKVLVWTPMSTTLLAAAGLSTVNVDAVDSGSGEARTGAVVVAKGATLAVAAGGSVDVVTRSVRVDGAIVATSGSVGLTTNVGPTNVDPTVPAEGGDILIGAGGRISTAGRWVNDSGLAADLRGGRAHTDGGSIRLSTDTGAIAVARASVLDVSSGGYVDANGHLAESGGVPGGRSGSLALLNYALPLGNTSPLVPPAVPDGRTGITLAGHVRSRGFGSGGSFTLRALDLQIGGMGDEPPAGTLRLNPDFFAAQGFGSYALEGVFGARLAAGTALTVSARNALPDLDALRATPTGTALEEGVHYRSGRLDDTRRAPAGFSLRSSATLLVDQGASIRTDAGAALSLAGAQLTLLGRLHDPAGTVSLSGVAVPGGAGTGSVWLGGDSVVDVSGTTLVDPLAPPERLADGRSVVPRIGRVLDGGSIDLRYDGGYVVAAAGSVLDVSGAAGRLDLPLARTATDGRRTAPQIVWSDAGSITALASSGLFLDATLRAQGGAPEARGGSLSILPGAATGIGPAATAVVLQATGGTIAAGAAPGAAVEPALDAPSGRLVFAADRLAGSGLSDLKIGREVNGDPASAAVPIVFSGSLKLALPRSIELNAPVYTTAAAGSADAGVAPTKAVAVHLAAPYVAIDGYAPANGNAAPTATADGVSTLAIDAAQTDLGGRFTLDHFKASTLAASGDIRFRTEIGGFDTATGAPITGQLKTAGDLRFEAAQLYPATANRFAVIAAGGIDPATGAPAATTITVAGNAASRNVAAPLSAGGGLFFDATSIVQGGVLRAPGGQIVLGLAAGDAVTAARFDALELVATQSVVLASHSRTSVSLENQTLPYGSTVDGVDWRYSPQNQGTVIRGPRLTAPPAKQVQVSGDDVDLRTGSIVDVSGGGDLQASEWIAGTGGTRDVLARYNVDRSSASGATSVPLYPDERKVYAILPGYAGPLAPIDPAFGASKSPNFGHVIDLPTPGLQVVLTGVAALAAGTYTLLPAQYATLPGALRLVQDTSVHDVFATGNAVQPDGTLSVAGTFGDALTGSTAGRSTRFEVQPRAVWQQYSEYRSTGADAYFAALARQSGSAVPPRPVDAGRLSIGASRSLGLGATLRAQGAAGGANAQVDLASQHIQIVTGDATPRLDGYLPLAAADLTAIGAGSLLIGGTRSDAAGGVQITTLATSVVVSNDGHSALVAPELILVTRADVSGADADAANGLRLDAGSVVKAQGGLSGGATPTYLIGRNADPTTADPGVAGDGALLRLSNGAVARVVRRNLTDQAAGALLDVRTGATLAGGKSLTLDASGDVVVDPDAVLSGKTIDANSSRVSFVGSAEDGTGRAGLVIGPRTLKQFAAADAVTLRSRSSIDFVGDLDIAFDGDLTLGAGSFQGDGGAVTVAADKLTLDNALHAAAPAAAPAPGGSLKLKAAVLSFGGGAVTAPAEPEAVTVDGFDRVSFVGSAAIRDAGRSSFDFGAAGLTLTAPVFIAGAGADASLRTAGALTLGSAAGTAPTDRPLGGSFTFAGGRVDSAATVVAASGRVRLQASTGDVALASGAHVDVAGVAQRFFDVSRYAPGGTIELGAARGSVRLAAGSTLDFSGAPPASGSKDAGGDAGSLRISAPQQTVALGATILGRATNAAQGGSFALDAGGAVDLDALAGALATSGVDHRIAVRSGSGNLRLSSGRTLAAAEVQLIADGGAATGRPTTDAGHIEISGRIDASGASAGQITLYGRNGVAIDGELLARATDAGERGGGIFIGTTGVANGTLDAVTGRERVEAAGSGVITLGSHALIDVSPGSGGSGGTVALRLPLLADGDVALQAAQGARIVGARDVGVEAVGVWSATDAPTAGSSRHFDAVVDPAGWFDAGGQRVGGTWTDAQGQPANADGNFADPLLGVRPIDPSRDFFTPDAGAVNVDHRDFYQSTLAGFVRAPNFVFEQRLRGRFRDADGNDVFHARPGIELRNPDGALRGGNIDVLGDWNLGAGANESSLTYRYAGQPPVLTLRAVGDLNVRASISDGFYQRGNVLDVSGTYTAASDQYATLLGAALTDAYAAAPAELTGSDARADARYYGLYGSYANYLMTYSGALGGNAPFVLAQLQINGGGSVVEGAPAAPTPPADPSRYPQYLTAYQTYLAQVYRLYEASGFSVLPAFEPLAAPAAMPVAFHLATDTGAAPVRTVANPLPLQSATLMSGPSTSYRFAAGANLASTDPLAVHVDSGDAAAGSVVIDGHVRYSPTIQPGNYGNETVVDSLLPTMIRTGTGRIDIAAAADVRLADTAAAGVIVSAGRQLATAALDVGVALPVPVNPSLLLPTNGVNQPVGGGDVSIRAGRDLRGREALFLPEDGSVNNVQPGAYYAQHWAPWTETANRPDQTGINFSGFDQGVLAVGGRIALKAGRDIVEFAASSPTTWTLAAAVDGSQVKTIHGGGNLTVDAGRDILSGSYFVSKGRADIVAGGRIGASYTLGPFDAAPNVSGDVSTLIALQDGQVRIRAAQGVDLGGIYNPSALLNNAYAPLLNDNLTPRSAQPFSSASSVDATAVAGDLRYGSLKAPDLLFAFGGATRSQLADPFVTGGNDYSTSAGPPALPAALRFTAFDGGLSVERSGILTGSQAALELVATQKVQIFDDVAWRAGQTSFLGVGPLDAAGFAARPPVSPNEAVARAPLRIYSVAGDIVDGRADPATGDVVQPLQVIADRPARIVAGRDIEGLWFRGQNNAGGDITRIAAGRDLYDAPLVRIPGSEGGQYTGVDIQLGGPGTLLLQAGRNLGPFVALDEALANDYPNLGGGVPSGVKTIGNAVDPRLPIAGADLVVLYGVAPGIDLKAFEQRYIDPAAGSASAPYAEAMVAFVHRQQGESAASNLDANAAYRALQAMPEDAQTVFVQQVLLDLLKRTGIDYADPASAQYRQYASGYRAISTLFPAKFGYTANSLNGNNGAETTVATGDLDLRGSTLQTQSGGNIALLAPGGQALVGSTAATSVVTDASGNVVIGPNQTGILTLKAGNISAFADRDILLAQSRIFTERGGDILLWSSNGDVNAGKGAKTSADAPAPLYICTPDNYCRVDAAGQVSGAGIATLQTVAGTPAGNAVLVAPRGTVDAGDAGIRVAGNLIVAAQAVANADNLQVSGSTVGVPSARIDSGALAAASGTAAAAEAQAQSLATRRPSEATATLITVEVVGFGASDEAERKRRQRGQ